MIELYQIPGFEDPIDLAGFTEEQKKAFYVKFPNAKQVKQNDPAVNAEANVGSTKDMALNLDTGSLEYQEAKKLIDKSLFNPEKIEELTLVAENDFNILEQNISQLTTREEEGEEVTKKLRKMPELPVTSSGVSKFPNFGLNLLSKLSKSDVGSKIIGDFVFNKGASFMDYLQLSARNVDADGAEEEAITYKDIEKKDSDIIKDKKLVKDSQEIKNFNLLKKNQELAAVDILQKQGNKNITDEQIRKYIEENNQDEDFKTSVKEGFIKGYIKERQKEALIEKNKKESGWDGFTEGENQNRLEEAAALVASNLDKQAQSNIATSVNIDSKIQKIDQSLKSLQTLKPKNQEEADLIIE